MRKNLLPNASFELSFGEQIPTNWGDLQNVLTLKLTASGQGPKTPPGIERQAQTVDGEHVAVIPLERTGDESVGHLTSPAVPIKQGRAYTLSVHACSSTPSTTLELAFWTRPVDWTAQPDVLSHPMALTATWQRLSFTFVTDELVDRGVVDLIARTFWGGTVLVDAVQLEEGPVATDFETRYPVEGSLADRRRPAMLHFLGEPLQLYLTTYNHTEEPGAGGMTLNVERLLDGVEVFTHAIADPVPPGRHEEKLSIDFPLLGEFRATLRSAEGEEIGVDDYMFVVHPVMGEDFQGVLYSREGKADQLPAERAWLPWENKKTWYADPPQGLTVTRNDKIYVPLTDGQIARTPDGGRTWDVFDPGRWVLSVLREGAFLAATYEEDRKVVILERSRSEGKTWERVSEIPSAGPRGDPITELANGDLIWTGASARPQPLGGGVCAYRSSDGGRSWSEGHPICPGAEAQIIELASGRLLAVVRDNAPVPADDWQRCFRNEMAWRHFQRLSRQTRLTSYVKRLLLAESDDGGVTWTNVRPGTFLLNEMHGGAVELPDRRVVLLYTHRCPPLRGGERAKVSRDGGRTWDPELYYLNTTRAFPGYSAACVLPPHLGDGEPGMILTVVGERSEGNWGDGVGPPTSEGIEFAPRMQAIRWRPLD